MPGILSLPTELIVAIISYLSHFKLRELLSIYNRRWFKIVQEAYDPHRWYVENALRHTNGRFQRLRVPGTDILRNLKVLPDHLVALNAGIPPLMQKERVPRVSLPALGLDEACDGFVSFDPPYLRSWMKLSGSLDWLIPLEDQNASLRQSSPDPGKSRRFRKSRASYEETERQALKLGLTLPPAFVKLYSHESLMSYLPDDGYSSWLTGDQILKCPSQVGGRQNDGYLIPFFQQGDQFHVSLYLERAGWHCVVLSTVKPSTSRANLGILSETIESRSASLSVRMRRDEALPRSTQVNTASIHICEEFSMLPAIASQERARETEVYITTVRDLAKLNICNLSEVDAAAREGLQLGLNLLFHGPMTIIGLTFEEFLVSFFFEEQLALYFSHLQRSPSEALREYVAHRYLPLYQNAGVESITQLIASMGDVYR